MVFVTLIHFRVAVWSLTSIYKVLNLDPSAMKHPDT
jgi:hypothetical protein